MRVVNHQLSIISMSIVVWLSACATTPVEQALPAPSENTPLNSEPLAAEPVPDVDNASLFTEALRYQKTRQWRAAAQLWQRQVVEEPSQLSGWHNLAICLRELKQWSEAEEAIAQALVLEPMSSHVLNEQAYIFRKQGKFDAAEASYLQALSSDSIALNAYLNLAILYDLYLARPKEAIVQYQKYLSFQPDDAQVQQWLRVLVARYGQGE